MNRRAAFLQFNAGVERARRDYCANPTRACLVRDCWNLHDNDNGLCHVHRRDRREAAQRMHARRRAVK